MPLAGFAAAGLALKHFKSLFLFHSRMNCTQVLFKPKVCSSLVKHLMSQKQRRRQENAALWPPCLQSCGSTCSSGMKSSCCRQSQPGFARREVNLAASSWQLRRILWERGGVTPSPLHLPGAPGGSQRPYSTTHLCWESLKCLTSDCQHFLQGLSAAPGHPAGTFSRLTLLW